VFVFVFVFVCVCVFVLCFLFVFAMIWIYVVCIKQLGAKQQTDHFAVIMRRVFKRETTGDRAVRRKSVNEEDKKNKSGRIHERRRSKVDGDLTTGLLAKDGLQMQSMPKSFFGHDEEASESAASTAQVETFDSVGYSWDFVLVLPVTAPEGFEEPFLEPSEVWLLVDHSF
jgi:hypothetical protein